MIVSSCFSLPEQVVAAAFPFHFVLNQDMKIVQAGNVLQRLYPGLSRESKFEQYFKINRPIIPVGFNSILEQADSLFLIESLHNKMQLKGQIVHVRQQEVIFFLGSPWIIEIDSLKRFGLTLKDFAIYDPVVDFLFLVQAQNTALADAKKLTNKLAEQRAELRDALKVKEELAKAAQMQSSELEKIIHELRETQSQLIQTEKMSGLGQLVAGIAHEINNPINFIHGNIGYASKYTADILRLVYLYQQFYPNSVPEIEAEMNAIDFDFLKEDLPKMLASMKMGTDRIRQIVLSLRNFSRLDEAEVKPVDIHEGIDSTLLILQHRLKANPERPAIQIVKQYGKLPKIECYAGQLNQVFMNIIANAIDALDEYNSQLSLEERQHYQSNIRIFTKVLNEERVTIQIADNGPGIKEPVKQRLFDPFFTTKPIGKGTGLGLSISYKIVVEKHGGQLKCISTLGKGTAFQIEVPIKQPKKYGENVRKY